MASGTLDPKPSRMARADFVTRFGSVYEHSPWIAETAYDAGLSPEQDTPEGLAEALARVVAQAGDDAGLALIRGHPDLAGRAAIAGDLTDSSRSEQAGAGLDRCTPEEFRRFQALNAAYKEKFGFPFILAVGGRTRQEILEAFERRVDNAREAEFRTALEQIDQIALLRLQAIETRIEKRII